MFLAAAFTLIHRSLITGSFAELEINKVREDVGRGAAAIEQSMDKLAMMVQDWAAWDATYNFLRGENDNFPQENLVGETLANLDVNLVVFVSLSGEPLYSCFFDFEKQELTSVTPSMMKKVLAEQLLVHPGEARQTRKGIIMTERGPMIMASSAVVKGDFTGSPAGSLIMGRLVDSALVSRWSPATRLKVAILSFEEFDRGSAEKVVRELTESGGPPPVKILNKNEIEGYHLIRDLRGRPAVVLAISERRDTYEYGLSMANASFLWLMGIGFFFTLLSWFLIEWIVLSRWSRLDRDVQEIGRSMDFNRRLSETTSDEIGRVTSSINQMLENLQTAEDRRKEVENRFSHAFEKAAVGMALVDCSGRFITTNPFLREMFGYSQDELVGLRFLDVTLPEDQAIGLLALEDMIAGKRDHALYERLYLHKDGHPVWCMVSAALIRDDENLPLYFVALVQDISQQKQAESERREYLEQLRMITDNLPVLIGFVGADQRYRFANKEYEKWFGLSPEKIVGMSVQDVLGGIGYTTIREEVQAALSGKTVSYEGEMLTTDGGLRRFFSRYIPHIGDDGTVGGYFVLVEDITERKAAEEVLARTREQYELLAKNTADLVAICNTSAEFTFVSPSYETQLGYGQDELLGRPVTDLVHPDDLAEILDIIAEHYQTLDPNPITTEYRMRRKNGDYLWFETRGQVLFDNDDPTGAIFNTRNVTERKRAEDALRESEALFSGFMHHLPAIAFVKDAKGKYLFANEGFRSILGFEPRDWIGKTDAELFPGDVAALLVKHDNIVRQTGQSLERLEPVADSSGQEHAQLTVKFPISLPSYSDAVAGISMDITARVRAEEELRESEEKYRTILQSTAHSITITEQETGRYFEVNEGFIQLTGYSREEALGKTVYDLNMFVDAKVRDRLMETMARDGQVTGAAVQYKNKYGEIIDTVFSAKPLRYAGRDCLVAVVQDVTSLREAEREHARLLNQLQQAQKMEAIGTLAGGIAHDFNNILQAITGYLELLKRLENQHPKARKYIVEIDEVSRRAADLVRQLLTFSRRVEPTLKPLDLNDTVRSTVGILEHTIPRMIQIKTMLADGLKLTTADASQLDQVLMNLATNARDAMPQGGSLLIETDNFQVDENTRLENPEFEDDEYVVMRVSDTGEGMDEETLKNIFTPFFTTKGVGKGTGLGLAMVYGIVQAHGGHIRCESEAGHGTRFSIFLPVLHGFADVTRTKSSDFESELKGTETVLLVDDERGIIDVASEMLRQYGYKVITAGSGEEALTVFCSNPSAMDVVILDLGMPGMGGVKCLEEMVKIRPDVKAIVASGYSRVGQTDRLRKLGVTNYLQKPYRLTEMMTTLRQVIDN